MALNQRFGYLKDKNRYGDAQEILSKMLRVKILRNHTVVNFEQYRAFARVFNITVEAEAMLARKKPVIRHKNVKKNKLTIDKSVQLAVEARTQKEAYIKSLAEMKQMYYNKKTGQMKGIPEQSWSICRLLLSDVDLDQCSKDYSKMSATYKNILEPKRFLNDTGGSK